MAAYSYIALTAAGAEKKGVLHGDNDRHVRQQLREQGLMPVQVDMVVEHAGKQHPGLLASRGIQPAELALVTRQLATLVDSGLPLVDSLQTVARQNRARRVQAVLMAVRSRVMEGHSLAGAMESYPRAFPELYRATVEAGEHSGVLGGVLHRLAVYAESRQSLTQKARLALLYPSILTLVAVAVVAALLIYVVPDVVQVFQNMNQNLPPLTSALIATSDFLRADGHWLLLAMLLAAAGFSLALRMPTFRFGWHRVLLSTPLVGRLVRGLNTARFARTFSILTASGVPVLEGLRIAARVIANLPMRDAVRNAIAHVSEGREISAALERSGHFPPMTVQLIAGGESSGDLDNMLERAADSQEREVEDTIAMLLGVFEPLLILLMGGVVLLIVIAILLPIFELNQMVV